MSSHRKQKYGTLYVTPTTISTLPLDIVLPKYTLDILKNIRVFAVENIRTTRRAVNSLEMKTPIQEIEFLPIKSKSDTYEIGLVISRLRNGIDVSLMSDAGTPNIADPGNILIMEAHRLGIPVIPLIGPSSITMALSASGLNGQHSRFYGYLPKFRPQRIKKIRDMEQDSYTYDHSCVFIETPYRNIHLLQDLVATLRDDTFLTVAQDITGMHEYIKTWKIKQWKIKKWPYLQKIPAIYVIDHP